MPKTVLIVDDSELARSFTAIVLRKAGYDILEAVNGTDALAKLDGRQIHLILSDINMPTMDGITFVKEAKKLAAYQFTPVVMVTAESLDSVKQESKIAGAKAWLAKPFESTQILALVAEFILP